MKKSLSIMLVFAMVLSLITVIPVSAAVSRAVWDFTDGTLPSGVFTYNATPTKSEEWAVVTDDATTQNDITLGNYVKTDYRGTWPNFYWSPGQTTLADGQTMELEFDMKVENYASNFQFRFDGTAAYRLLITTGGALKRRIDDTTAQELTIPLIQDKSLTHPGGKGWNRYKIVFQGVDAKLSDAETTHKAIKLTGFYLNGVNQIDTTAASFASQDPAVNGCLWAAFDSDKNYNGSDARKFTSMYLTFKGVAGGVNEVLSFDNLSKTTYAEGDTAPADRSAFVTAIRAAQTDYAEKYAAEGIDPSLAETFAAYQASIASAWALYNSDDAEQSALNAKTAELESYSEQLNITLPETLQDWNIWDFENESTIPPSAFTSSRTGNTFSNPTDDSDRTIHKYLKLDAEKGWTDYRWWANGDQNGLDTAFYNDNEKTVVEFDMKMEGFGDKSYVSFRFRGMDSTEWPIKIRNNGVVERGIGSNDDVAYRLTIGNMAKVPGWTYESLANWNRYKFEFEATKVVYDLGDGTTSTKDGRKLVGLYVNDVNVLNTSSEAFSSTDPAVNGCLWGVMDANGKFYTDKNSRHFYGINFCFNGTENPQKSVSLDNMSVMRYKKNTDTMPNRSGMITAIRKAQKDYENVSAEISGYETELAEYNTCIGEAWGIYNLQTATQNSFDLMIQKLERYEEMFGEPEILSVLYGDAASLTSNGSITGVTLKKTVKCRESGVVLVGLYRAGGKEMIGAALARNVFDGKNLGEFSVTFANSIKIPENIEGVSVKAMLFGDLENITPLHMIEQ